MTNKVFNIFLGLCNFIPGKIIGLTPNGDKVEDNYYALVVTSDLEHNT